MSLNLPYGIKPVVPLSNLDKDRYGPWPSLNDALIATQGTRERGLTIGLIENNKIIAEQYGQGQRNGVSVDNGSIRNAIDWWENWRKTCNFNSKSC